MRPVVSVLASCRIESASARPCPARTRMKTRGRDQATPVRAWTTSGGVVRGALWRPNGSMIDLGTLGGNEAIPNDINELVQVVGEANDSTGTRRAFAWDSIDGIQPLGPTESAAHGINEVGQIVGWSAEVSNPVATIWQVVQDSNQVRIELVVGESLEARPSGTGGDVTVTFRLSVVNRAGQSMPTRPISLTIAAVPSSGGHNHTAGARPAGSLNVTSPFTTDSIGFRTVIYTTPIHAGRVALRATSTNARDDVDTVIVRVPGLGELADGTNLNRIGVLPEHPSSHWGTPQMILAIGHLADSLMQRAQRYNSGLDSLPAGSVWPGVGGEAVLGVNDMSIVWGGQFDWDAAHRPWTPPHAGHRVGLNVDLDIRGKTSLCPDSALSCSQRQDSLKYDYYFRIIRQIWEGHFRRSRLGDERRLLNHVHLNY